MQISGEVNDIILKGYELAKGNKDEFVTAEHLLYGITFVERFINALSKLNGSAVNLRKKLDEYIIKNNYEIIDDSIEIQLVDPSLITCESEMVSEIQVPVRSRLYD